VCPVDDMFCLSCPRSLLTCFIVVVRDRGPGYESVGLHGEKRMHGHGSDASARAREAPNRRSFCVVVCMDVCMYVCMYIHTYIHRVVEEVSGPVIGKCCNTSWVGRVIEVSAW
jgi:hypothetical protein